MSSYFFKLNIVFLFSIFLLSCKPNVTPSDTVSQTSIANTPNGSGSIISWMEATPHYGPSATLVFDTTKLLNLNSVTIGIFNNSTCSTNPNAEYLVPLSLNSYLIPFSKDGTYSAKIYYKFDSNIVTSSKCSSALTINTSQSAQQSSYTAIYYVSPLGSDINSGTMLSSPFKTIKTALDNATIGSAIYVFTGTYIETVSISASQITLSAYPNNTPVIDGLTTLPSSDWGSLISIRGNNNFVSGFEVRNSNINGSHLGGYGIQITGHHNTVSKMNVHHTWETGIIAQGDFNIVEDSSIFQASYHHSSPQQQASVSSGWASGLSAARNHSADALEPDITYYTIFRRNKVYNNWGEGLSCFEAAHCTIEDNVIFDNWTVNLYISDARYCLVQRNMVYVSSNPAIATRNNSHPGLVLADEVSTVPRSANNIIINNFIYNTGISAFSWTQVPNSGLINVLIAHNTIVDGNLNTGDLNNEIINTNSQIKNNIILGSNSNIPNTNGITFSNNNWTVLPSLLDFSNISGDPKIARLGVTTAGNLTAGYFKILIGSPAINTATPLSNVTDDFFKTIRGAAPDIGAYEF